jgi:hypothetical protein
MAALDAAMEAAQDTTARPYLGISQIGHACDRHLWLSFHWAEERRVPASGLRAIEDGHRGEDLMAERLRMIPGVKLLTVDPATGKQFAVEHGGHVRGHLDGIITGILEAPKTPHVWEHKQVNEKKFADLRKCIAVHGEKGALAQWDPIYHAQALCYMHLRKLTRHFLTVGTPGGREYISVRTEADQSGAARACGSHRGGRGAAASPVRRPRVVRVQVVPVSRAVPRYRRAAGELPHVRAQHAGVRRHLVVQPPRRGRHPRRMAALWL